MKDKYTAYMFNSEHLGNAFLKELLGMGYKIDENFTARRLSPTAFKMIVFKRGVLGCHNHHVTSAKETFQLESQWQEALDFAKAQIEPEFKEGDYFGYVRMDDSIDIGRIDKIEHDYFYGVNLVSESHWEGHLKWLREECFTPSQEQIKEVTEKAIEVNGYKAEFKKGYVKFGCAEIENSIFEEIQEFIESENPMCEGIGNRALTAFKIGEGLFDIETIQEINKRLK